MNDKIDGQKKRDKYQKFGAILLDKAQNIQNSSIEEFFLREKNLEHLLGQRLI